MTYSLTQLGNLVKLISALLVLVGFTVTPDQQQALVVVIGLVAELIGFTMSWFGRLRAGGISVWGFKR